MSRATLEVMSRDEREGRLRVIPVIINDKVIYKLPQTNMLPDSMFYAFKEIRDWLWLKFSFGDEREAKTVLILADKKIAEAMALSKEGSYELAFETSMKAIDKLKYANVLAGRMENQKTAQKQITFQVKTASVAYSEIINDIGQKSESNSQKYILLQQEINDFKEEQIQKETNN